MKCSNKIASLLLIIVSLSACKSEIISENEIIKRAINAYGGEYHLCNNKN